MDKIFPQLWMQLSRESREHLAKVFELPRTGITEIRNQDVISDGYTQEDLAHITAEKMEHYVGSKETFSRLWELTVAKCRHELNPPKGMIISHQLPDITPMHEQEHKQSKKDHKKGKQE
jgi:hypothetical protein